MTDSEAGKVSQQPHVAAGLVALTPDEAHSLAMKLHKCGLLDEAEMLFRRILDAAPDMVDALHFLALICHQKSRIDEAVGLIERVIAIDPTNADAYNNLGNMLEGLGRVTDAEVCYRKAIAANANHAPAHNNLGVMLLSQLKADEAIELYRRAVALEPDSADFHYNLGNALRKSGELQGAVDAYRGALSRNQHHDGAWQGLARSFLLADRRDLAKEAYEEWLRVETGNPGISFLLSACTGEGAPARAPETFVQKVFDNMADTFDSHLASLNYRAPNLLVEALTPVLPAPEGNLDILDAGCGTGLCGPLLRPYARKLTGVDLSSGMLAKAAGRKMYDDLYQAELTVFIGHYPEAFDVIASADTLCYFGDLDEVFRSAATALKPGGFFSFTLEDAGNDVTAPRLNVHGRYMHPWKYVDKNLMAAGFRVHSYSPVVLRSEGGDPVAGHLVVACKRGEV